MSPALALLVALVAPAAHADGVSADVELIRPGFTQRGLPGVDSARIDHADAWRVGLLGQFEQDPLILYEFGHEVGPIVDTRAAFHLGVSREIGRSAAVRLVFPAFAQGDGELPELGAGGAGAGDLSAAGVFRVVEAGPVLLGARAEIVTPTGRKDAWMGEENLRTAAALLADAGLGPVDLLADAGPVLRTGVSTRADFELKSELAVSGGARYHVLPDRVAVYVATAHRTGLQHPWSGGAASPAESWAGTQVRPVAPLLVDIGVGRGWTAGYGTTQNRLMLGATWRLPEKKPPELVPVVEVVPEEPPPPPPEPEVVPADEPWGEDELARVKGERIEIRDPIQFEFATDHILPVSLPVLRAVAEVMAENDRIGHVVVEGHASEEGTFEYNYDLSIRRARAIWEELVVGGVHPDRLSYRGMGEVAPSRVGADEGALAANRRAEFHIIYQLGPLELAPRYPSLERLPWSGQPAGGGPTEPGRAP